MNTPIVPHYRMGDVFWMVRSQVLREDALVVQGRIEAKSHSSQISEDGEGSGRAADVESNFSFRHDPAAIGEGAFLRCQRHGAVGKPCGKDKRPLPLRLDVRKIKIPRHAGGSALPDAMADDVAFPCLAALERPVVGENLIAGAYRARAARKWRGDSLPVQGADNLVHALLRPTRPIEKQVRVGAGPKAGQRVTHHAHGAAHGGSNVNL